MPEPDILPLLQHCEKRSFPTGEIMLEQGGNSGRLLFLIEGGVEVLKDDVLVATISQPGATFGELSVLLGVPHTASVRARTPSTFYVVDDPRTFLESSPSVCLHVCRLLARRLDSMTRYLVDVKHQLAGDDHLGLVDGVLATLLHRQAAARTRPPESTIRHDEMAE